MIPELGLMSLIIALGCAITLGLGLSSYKLSTTLGSLRISSTYSFCFFVLVSFTSLIMSFLSDDFSVKYVAVNSNTQLPLLYKLCAAWGGHEGSLLLWVLILSFWMIAFAFRSTALPERLRSTTLGILGCIAIGFTTLLIFSSSPFIRELPFVPLDGNDLNPLLQDLAFALHPPILYMGYVGFSVPFALSLAYLIVRPEEISWSQIVRPWVLVAWSFLTLGITLGSWWAYYELGWGGWWFWDPVENASLMPWLAGAGLVHAALMSKNKADLEAWSILLALSTFILSLMGTFLVRSGVISSVHAFASDPRRGVFILIFLALVLGISATIYVVKARMLWDKKIHLLSKQSFLFLSSLLFFISMSTVLLGTLYPLFMEVLLNEKLSVGPPYFNMVMTPIIFCLLVGMSIAPFLKWHSDSMLQLKELTRKLVWISPFTILIIYFLPAGFFPIRWVGIVLGALVVVCTLFRVIMLLKNGKHIVLMNSGIILAHLGFAISILGMITVSTLEIEREIPLTVGQTKTIGGYQFTFLSITDKEGSNTLSKVGHFIIEKNSIRIGELSPLKSYFIIRDQALSETAILPGLIRDFYIALGDNLEGQTWSVRIYIKPFVRAIWLGGLLIALGAILAALFDHSRARRLKQK